MDIAAASVVMSHNQLQSNASLAVMKNAKGVMEQQGQQLIEMLQQPQAPSAPHPSLGGSVDVEA